MKPHEEQSLDLQVRENLWIIGQIEPIYQLKNGKTNKKCHELSIKCRYFLFNKFYFSDGAIEDVEISEAKMQFEVNLFGLARLVQLVLPHMRKQKSGRIINVSSMGGRLTTYFGAWYHATKYALEVFSDALRMEVADFGIDVSLIEPGGIKTEWGIIAADKLANSAKSGAYEKEALKTAEGMKKQYSGNMLSNPLFLRHFLQKMDLKA